ncbi:MAG TPA: DoxX family membrane protein [Verrucomicrobiae bacterium]|jgi:uncharacterized membrane protein YphA (DoxX/SURF4 family)|nr:DoxX family membrane protein [Verrucomicrobiae bacterium]
MAKNRNIGLYLYAFGSFAAGVFDLIWRNFDAAHQPLQAWGDNIPGATIFAYITGLWMIASAIALLGRRTKRIGGVALAAIYFIFAIFWLPRFYTAPHYLGQTFAVYIGVFAGFGTEAIAFAAGVLVWASADQRGSSSTQTILAMRWIFGICAIGFGLQHLTNIKNNLEYVPKWLPPGAEFWVIVTGVCFVLAGLAILTGILDVLAAWLLGLMFLVFNLTILPTYIFADPKNHAAWGGNAYNLAAVGSSWILAQVIASSKKGENSWSL